MPAALAAESKEFGIRYMMQFLFVFAFQHHFLLEDILKNDHFIPKLSVLADSKGTSLVDYYNDKLDLC